MKVVTIFSLFVVAAAADTLSGGDPCKCDTSKCPSSGKAKIKCIAGLQDACYVKQTQQGIDCGKPKSPDGFEGSTKIQEQACDSYTKTVQCGNSEICYYPDKSCDPHQKKCTGLCASDFCGGRWQKSCADSRWSCVYDDACLKSGRDDCNGKCVLN